MFKELIDLFRRENLIDQALAETQEMLDECSVMFVESLRSLRHSDTAELPFDIVKKDKMINKYQRRVRRKVITHLAIAGTDASLTPGLILISIVIDVERIGDYTKNIWELACAQEKKLTSGIFESRLTAIEEEVTGRFQEAKEAFAQTDVDLAKKLMREHSPITKECDILLNEIIAEKDPDLNSGKAVVLALYIRYLKRISSHLTNIVSSVANPFARIGYRSEDANENG